MATRTPSKQQQQQPAYEYSASGDGPTLSPLGVITQEYISVASLGVGRILLPSAPRTDGVTVVQLPYAVAYVQESQVKRLDDYKEKQKAMAKQAEKSAKLQQRRSSTSGPNTNPTAFPTFAPLRIPTYRRRQMLALAVSSFFSLICVAVSIMLIRGPLFVSVPFVAYVVWMFVFQSYHKDGKGFKSRTWRSMRWWTWFRDYFPISLHATAPLDPKGRYVIGYHPHGILSLGAFLSFGTEATGFSEKFPGIDLRLLTLTSNFRIPFYGFFLSMMGIADASRESCNNCLQRGPGSAIVLVLGGAKESLDAHAHADYELTLHRKGFVKVALENQADLVPVFSFGENDVWDQVRENDHDSTHVCEMIDCRLTLQNLLWSSFSPQVDNPRGSKLRKLQNALQQALGFALPIVKGRGITNYEFGLLAHRRPVTTFVGGPIVLPKLKKAEITDEIITEWHTKYKEALGQGSNSACGERMSGRAVC
jgi:2-acylglycerol O-acyltransferase 2